MSWLGAACSIIRGVFQGTHKAGVTPPEGLEGARVWYVNEGRGGRVVFGRGLKSFEMYFEFGGGDVVATIDVPGEDAWRERTGFALEQRRAILEYVGACVVRDQVTRGRGRYEVHTTYISVHV